MLETKKVSSPKGENKVYYRQKFDTFIRNYEGAGYISNTGNFSDRVVNGSGTVFLTALSREPQALEALVQKVCPEDIIEDARNFYDQLFEDSFLTRGNTIIEELNANDIRFSYSALEPKIIKKDFTPIIQRAKESTQDYLERHFKGKPQLASFQIELTSKCNERCVHCYIPHEFKLTNIKPELYYNVLKQLQEMDTLSVTLSGGEPMCHPKFKEFLQAAKDYDFSVNVLSNLTLVDDEIINIMKNSRLSSVQVSLYSMNPAHHDEITQLKGSFEKTKNAILRLIENDIPYR